VHDFLLNGSEELSGVLGIRIGEDVSVVVEDVALLFLVSRALLRLIDNIRWN